MQYKVTLLSLLMITLYACSGIAPPPKQNWLEQKSALSRIENWQLNGKIAVQTLKDSGSATITWIKRGDRYSLTLLGPLGTNGLTLNGQRGEVILQMADGKTYRANNPEQLLKTLWGFELPVSYLVYWVRALPVPNKPYKEQFDDRNRLIQLQQEGWNITFQSYTSIGMVMLPTKILITSPYLKTKMIIYQWLI